MKLSTPLLSGLFADSINDPNSTRKVYLLAAGLAVLGIALVAITIWFWRSTRHDPELLAPLEVMGGRRFPRLDGGAQREVLDESRPVDALPMQWAVQRGSASSDPEVARPADLHGALAEHDALRNPALIASAHEDIPGGLAVVDAAIVLADDSVASASIAAESVAAESVSAESIAAESVAEDSGIESPSDLDSILAAAGAVVPGAKPKTPALASAPAAPAKEFKDFKDIKDLFEPRGPVPAELAAADHEPATPPPGALPLVIVPVDHDLRTEDPTPSPKSTPNDDGHDSPDDGHDAFDNADDPVHADKHDHADDTSAPTSIDPLLRMFDRNDT